MKDHLKFAVEVIYKPGEDDWHPQLLIKITEWTTMNDVKSIWNKVETCQNLMSKKLEKKTNFTRDLCWHDLNKELGLKPRQIAEIWIEKYLEVYKEDFEHIEISFYRGEEEKRLCKQKEKEK